MKSQALIVIAILLLGKVCFAGAVELKQGQFDLEVEAVKQTYFADNQFLAETDDFEADINDDSFDESIPGRKSPFLAALMSAVIPGAGQVYNGSSLVKTLGFLAVEGSAWAGHVVWHGDGEDLTDAFEAYADAYWHEGDTLLLMSGNADPEDYENYRGWLWSTYGQYDDEEETHSLPDTKTQQYYEMIGKYNQFRAGWEDYWADGWDQDNYLTPMRLQYETMRDKANNKLNQANAMIYVVVLNHLFAAVDAAVSAVRHNNQFSDDDKAWGLEAEVYQYSVNEKIPMIRATYTF